ncbi:hypothetical protein [Gloeobacter morelensis]|uniref:Carboxypeptidase regulatory-like domain-containing protein n=1 Tax=Gloeobacter morelensis MG652769 TaxID=2781736 RepID=A0ABY3PRZ7_9CYAN|nr:hypothetical protein [Gloeobacter morelensis]UFP96506.1 hypothetical protein ISF26_09965 [Gloeobacter morelensis MG652769]
MLVRWFAPAVVLGVLAVGTASAAPIVVAIKDIKFAPCPAAAGKAPVISTNDQSNQPARCYRLTGTATNPAQDPVQDIDVFGRITDASGTAALTRRRIGSIDALPVGTHPVRMDVFLPESAKPPFKIEITRASGSSKASRPDRQDAPPVP